ncbi:MAG: FMN-binding protein [Candidatus Omnitrophica bacterium]|jgi:electron transport complex protein RnfG|nr:FMN-binding protein [Candidatus Omnitrophota bacterium]
MVRLKIICFVTAGLLLGLAQIEAGEELDFKEVLPQASQFMPVKKGAEVFYYKAQDQDGKLIGAVFKAEGKSYSAIETLVGMLSDGTIVAIKVLSQNETPGIGSRITEPQFTDQFRNIKDISKVQAITGATVSSQVVIDAVRKKAEAIKELLKDEA